MNIIEQWKNIKTEDKILEKELHSGVDLTERFKDPLEFGTGGIRCIMGAGTDRLNIHTISLASKAYGEFLLKHVKDSKTKGVVIGHDNRHNNKLFTLTAAKVLLSMGIKTYIYADNEMQPTPLVSYTIRRMKLAGGIIITASHNPKEYNGFKAYNEFGGQLVPSDSLIIQDNMKSIDPLKVERSNDEPELVSRDIVSRYEDEVLSVIINNDDERKLKIVFSPQHATSRIIAPNLLKKMGIEYSVVESQMFEDPDFINTESPNPEDPKSLTESVKQAKETNSDMAMTTDPDADRFGLATLHEGEFVFLNGNQIAALYLDYKLKTLSEMGQLPQNGYIVTSIVSGNMARRISEKHDIEVITTHVGFKNMADVIENKKDGTFLMAFEESYGFLLDGDIARDKDSFQAIVGIAEMANNYKVNGYDLMTQLKNIFKEVGEHWNKAIAMILTDEEVQEVLNKAVTLKEFNGVEIKTITDFRTKPSLGLSKANLVKIELEDGSWIAIRPSGTEPKVKFYMQSVSDFGKGTQALQDLENEIHTVFGK